ncbi:Transposase [Ceratobasidium theobromae]|uniref:Transposase n=1 Tax=Ceratobasidium theobromae TaxID=1582974 RepID=A0A5N5Q7U5_9AGAM|nr:Transposase [Ceratobasidium theobromae]
MPKVISPVKLAAVLAGLDKGDNYAKIACDTSISHGTISNIHAECCPDLKMSVGGCPCKISPTAACHATCLITHHNCVTAVHIAKTLNVITGQPVSAQTVHWVLKGAGLRALKKVRKPKLTKKMKWDCLAFAQAHQDWTIEDWKKVLWLDETKVNHLGSDGVQWVWVWKRKDLDERGVVETANFGGCSLMFWGCMSYAC